MEIELKNQEVLVTGGSGFIAAYCIMQLLKEGYRVRTTVRSLKREAEVRAMLKSGGVVTDTHLAFFEADLLSDKGWAEAVKGCDYVLHVASPFPPGIPKHEDELIVPAREGALRVLRASRDAGVKRVVLTSSVAAVGYGKEPSEKPFTESDWTNPNGAGVGAYIKSKTFAEKAAWEFIEKEGGSLELSVVNPVGVLGPVLGKDYSSSILLVKRLMDGSMPGIPKISFGIVDVRDVADLHVRCMTHEAAKGERFLAVVGDNMYLPEVAKVIKGQLGRGAKRVPTMVLPDWFVRFYALFDSSVAQVVPELGKLKNSSNKKAIGLLGWNPRSREESILATAESLLKHGIV